MNNKNEFPKFFLPVPTNNAFSHFSFVRRDSALAYIKVKRKDGHWIIYSTDKCSILSNPKYFEQISIEEVALL